MNIHSATSTLLPAWLPPSSPWPPQSGERAGDCDDAVSRLGRVVRFVGDMPIEQLQRQRRFRCQRQFASDSPCDSGATREESVTINRSYGSPTCSTTSTLRATKSGQCPDVPFAASDSAERGPHVLHVPAVLPASHAVLAQGPIPQVL